MAKVDIFSGFLGAGKTTLIKKLIKEAYKGEKVVLIENEFGEIGIDGSFMKDAGIEITEMNSGCICCSLVGDFSKALVKVVDEYNPDRILIEPSGVGKLSDVIKAVRNADTDSLSLNAFTTVADVKKCKMYLKNFGEFYKDQIENALCIVLSHTQAVTEEKIKESVALIKELNSEAVIVTTPWDSLSGETILSAMEHENTLENALHHLEEHHHEHEHHHHHEHEENCTCGCHGHDHHEHHHADDENCTCGCHGHDHHEHHHADDENCTCGCHDHDHHEHHHEHEENCTCGCHDHDHHDEHHHEHHHHADEVFTSWGRETARKYEKEELSDILKELSDEDKYGMVLRAKGIVASNGTWLHFDYIPEEADIREGSSDVTGRICVIGSKINEKAIEKLFKVGE